MVVEDIVGLDKRKPNEFYVPLYVLHNNSAWEQSKPKFENWLFSSSRYPKLDQDNKTILPSYSVTDNKLCSSLDSFELYSAMFIATLNKFYSTNDKKYAENCWKVMWSMRKLLAEFDYNIDINKLLEKKD